MWEERPFCDISLIESIVFLDQIPTKWDFVLVCDDHKLFSEKDNKKKKFLEELHKKGFITKVRLMFFLK